MPTDQNFESGGFCEVRLAAFHAPMIDIVPPQQGQRCAKGGGLASSSSAGGTALSSFSRGLSKVPKTMRVSMTYDQGKEMARHAELADRLNTPKSAWFQDTS